MGNLSVLQNLRAIEGQDSQGYSLRIVRNDALTSLEHLSNLRGSLPGALGVEGNQALMSLHGLEGITGVGKSDEHGISIDIRYNDNLASVAALRNIRGALPGALWVLGHGASLTSLTGLAATIAR